MRTQAGKGLAPAIRRSPSRTWSQPVLQRGQHRGASPLARAASLAARAAAAGEVATESLFALGHDGCAMLEPPKEPRVVTPAYACAWIAACLAAVLGIERQKRLFGGAPTIEPLLGGDALGCSVAAAARSQPRDHMAAARHVLRRLLPPAG